MLRATTSAHQLSSRRPDHPGLSTARMRLMNPDYGDIREEGDQRNVTIHSMAGFFGGNPYDLPDLFTALAHADRFADQWNQEPAGHDPEARGGLQIIVRVGLLPSPTIMMKELSKREPALRIIQTTILKEMRTAPQRKTQTSQRCPACTSNLFGICLNNHTAKTCLMKALPVKTRRQILFATATAVCCLCGSRSTHHRASDCHGLRNGRPCEACGQYGHQSYHYVCGMAEDEERRTVNASREQHFQRVQDEQKEGRLLYWSPNDFPEPRFVPKWPDVFVGHAGYALDPYGQRFPEPRYVYRRSTFQGIMRAEQPTRAYPPTLEFANDHVRDEFTTLEMELRSANNWTLNTMTDKYGWERTPTAFTDEELACYERLIKLVWTARRRNLRPSDFASIEDLERKLEELTIADRPIKRSPKIPPAIDEVRAMLTTITSDSKFSTQARREDPGELVLLKNNETDTRFTYVSRPFVEKVIDGSAAGERDLRAYLALHYQPVLISIRPPTRADHHHSLTQMLNQPLPKEPRALIERIRTTQWCITGSQEWETPLQNVDIDMIQAEMTAYAAILAELATQIATKDPHGGYYLETNLKDYTDSWDIARTGHPRGIPSLHMTITEGSELLEQALLQLQIVGRNQPNPTSMPDDAPQHQLQPRLTDNHREGFDVTSALIDGALRDEPATAVQLMSRPSLAALLILTEAKVHRDENDHNLLHRIWQAQRVLTGHAEMDGLEGAPDEVEKMMEICRDCEDIHGYYALLQLIASVIATMIREETQQKTDLPNIALAHCIDKILTAIYFGGSTMYVPTMKTFHRHRSTPWAHLIEVQLPNQLRRHLNPTSAIKCDCRPSNRFFEPRLSADYYQVCIRDGRPIILDPAYSLKRAKNANDQVDIKSEAIQVDQGELSTSTCSSRSSKSLQTAKDAAPSTSAEKRHNGGSNTSTKESSAKYATPTESRNSLSTSTASRDSDVNNSQHERADP